MKSMSDEPSDTSELQLMLRRFENAENSNDAETMIEMLADDAVIMVPNYVVQVGKAACAQFTREIAAMFAEHFERHITYTSDEVRQLGGSYAFDRGTFAFDVTLKSGGETRTHCGKYLFLYSRSNAGPWRCARMIVSLDDDEDDDHDGAA